jgi:DMSO/TMAO reductase YedYZ molybdopterin-dependent catalytic subunit
MRVSNLTGRIFSNLLTLLIVFLLLWPATGLSQDALPSLESTTPCNLTPIVVPTLPDVIPGYAEPDPKTGLHVTGTPKVVDLEAYRLEVTGKVKLPLSLTYDDLRCMPKIQARPTLVCPGFFTDTAAWSGVPLKKVLELAGLQDGAEYVRLEGADGYTGTIPLKDALLDYNLLAYELEGKTLPVLHGFPVRAVFPDLQGNRWLKWLIRIEVQ